MRYVYWIALCLLALYPYPARAQDTYVTGGLPADTFTITGAEPALADNIVITIDDCSIESNVRFLFRYLRDRGISATFFPNTHYISQQDPQLWRDIVAAGFEIGYHTRHHDRAMTPEQLAADYALFVQELRTILDDPGYTIRYARPPAGIWNTDWMTWANGTGLYTVRWNFTAPEITLPLLEGILANRTRGGSILLLHTGRADLRWMVDYLGRLQRLRRPDGGRYRLGSLTAAFHD